MAKKDETIKTVARLWAGGEKAQAVELAKAEKLKPEDMPSGMAERL